MNADERRLEDLKALCRAEIPGFQVDFKDTTSDWKMRAISKVSGVFNPDFNTMTTTLYPVVYFPSDDMDARRMFRILAHEYVHLKDEKDLLGGRVLFPLSYLFPQFLAVLSLLSFLAIPFGWSWLFCILFLAFAGPLPAPGRAYWELRGYATNLLCEFLYTGVVSLSHRDRIVETFRGWKYYRMWPFPNLVRDCVDDLADVIASGSQVSPAHSAIAEIFYRHEDS